MYNIYILNFRCVYNWHFYITTLEIGEKYCAINDALIFNGMFSALCVLTIITFISCVYTHRLAMVKTACPGGVNTLLYLKHPISFITFYTQQVALPRTTCLSVVFEDRVNNYNQSKQTEQNSKWISMFWYFSLRTTLKLLICVIPRKVLSDQVFNQIVVRGVLTWTAVHWTSCEFNTYLIFSRLSADFISKLKT